MNNASNFFKVICYADDSTLFISLCFKNKNKTCKQCNHTNKITNEKINWEIDEIYKWMCINKLSINIKKTKFMLFRYPQRKIDTSREVK